MEIEKLIRIILIAVAIIVGAAISISFANKVPSSLGFLDFNSLSSQQKTEMNDNFDSLTKLLQSCAASNNLNCWCNSDHQFPTGFVKGTNLTIVVSGRTSALSLKYGNITVASSTIDYPVTLPLQTGGKFSVIFAPATVNGRDVVYAFYKSGNIYLFNEGKIDEKWKSFKIEDCSNEKYRDLCIAAVNHNKVC